VKNLLDGDMTTVWATRENGGVGEEVVLFRVNKYFYLINGYGKSKNLYLNNNRVRELELNIYRYYAMIVAGATTEAGPPREAILINPLDEEEPLIEFVFKTNLLLKDEYLYTNKCFFPIDFDRDEKETGERIKKLRMEKGIVSRYFDENYAGYDFIGYILILTINSVYQGNKYNDLCISEIGFLADDK
jgi:hypothetical protein